MVFHPIVLEAWRQEGKLKLSSHADFDGAIAPVSKSCKQRLALIEMFTDFDGVNRL